MKTYEETEQAYNNGYQKGYEEGFKKGYEGGVDVGKRNAVNWIPVSESPKEKGCYLVSVNHWLDGKPVTREAFWNSADWLSCEKLAEITPRVTHWMSLPQPQKEGAK